MCIFSKLPELTFCVPWFKRHYCEPLWLNLFTILVVKMTNKEWEDRLHFWGLNIGGGWGAWMRTEVGRKLSSLKFWLAFCLTSQYLGHILSNSSIKDKYLLRICGMLKVWYDFSQSLDIWTYVVLEWLIMHYLSVFFNSVDRMDPLKHPNCPQQTTYEVSKEAIK